MNFQQILRIPFSFLKKMNTHPKVQSVITADNLSQAQRLAITNLKVKTENISDKGLPVADFLKKKVNDRNQLKDCATLVLTIKDDVARYYNCDENAQVTNDRAVAYLSY